jgi:hypothetical protein
VQPEPGRTHDVSAMSAADLEHAQRQLRASLALTRPGSPMRAPTEAQLSAIDAEVAERAEPCHWPQCRMFRLSGQTYCDEGRNCQRPASP